MTSQPPARPPCYRWNATSPPCSPPTAGLSPHHITIHRGHGRNEIRSIWTTSHVAGLDFPGVYRAFRIHRQIYGLNRNPLRKPETMHGITSLIAWQANPADLLACNRGHWEVENREHRASRRLRRSTTSRPRCGYGRRACWAWRQRLTC